MSKGCSSYLLIVVYVFFAHLSCAQNATAPKPLFDDPVYHGATDPVIIYNKQEKKWWMFYTNRRATAADTPDDREWKYLDTANINYRADDGYTFWAPEVIELNSVYHMYLTYVPGIFDNWNHPRNIIHLTSKDLMNWQYESTLQLANDKVIDACVFPL